MRVTCVVAAFLTVATVASGAALYHNAVGLKPGEFARFVAEPQGRSDHIVRVRDGRTEETLRRVLRYGEKRSTQFVGLQVRVAFNRRIRVRVFNGSGHGRRVRVRVSR